ncbi:MAG: hypothetical protein OEV37_01045 [Candidatus Berkelbacteria bacterium]|nr:hypothetical protein [Candidatus Berkelbacteria bacterium]
MGRIGPAVLMLLTFVVLAGCGGSGPGNGGGGDLQLSLTGGGPPTSGGGRMYYPMLEGESRPLKCTWAGGPVSGAPVWTITSDNPRVKPVTARFNAMRLPPETLGGNLLLMGTVYEEGWNRVRVEYGGQSKEVWVKGDPTDWSPPKMTAPLNASGARLEVVGDPSVWSTSLAYGSSNYWTEQTGVLEIGAQIVGDYPGASPPQWTAEQSRLEFVGLSRGWKVKFEIKDLQYGRFWPLTAEIGGYAVTVGISGNVN